jgi:hypothetical protein
MLFAGMATTASACIIKRRFELAALLLAGGREQVAKSGYVACRLDVKRAGCIEGGCANTLLDASTMWLAVPA